METQIINKEEFKKDFNSESQLISNATLLKKYGFESVKEMCDYARVNNLIIIKPQTEEDKQHLNILAEGLKDAMTILNETETEPFTIEERTDLNINKVTHDKVKRVMKGGLK